MAPTEEASDPLEKSEGGWVTQELFHSDANAGVGVGVVSSTLTTHSAAPL